MLRLHYTTQGDIDSQNGATMSSVVMTSYELCQYSSINYCSFSPQTNEMISLLYFYLQFKLYF